MIKRGILVYPLDVLLGIISHINCPHLLCLFGTGCEGACDTIRSVQVVYEHCRGTRHPSCPDTFLTKDEDIKLLWGLDWWQPAFLDALSDESDLSEALLSHRTWPTTADRRLVIKALSQVWRVPRDRELVQKLLLRCLYDITWSQGAVTFRRWRYAGAYLPR